MPERIVLRCSFLRVLVCVHRCVHTPSFPPVLPLFCFFFLCFCFVLRQALSCRRVALNSLPTLRSRSRRISEFEINLVYTVSSRTARTT